MLTIKKLSKAFKKKVALSEVSFDLSAGEALGIVGPNGSGKTTLLNILIGMLRPESGSFEIQTQKIGTAISRKGFFNDMSVIENIRILLPSRHGSIDELIGRLENFQIDFYKNRFGNLSAGMQQRVTLALAFLQEPELLLLDEPLNHLDIDSILFLRSNILRIKRTGSAFIITSHVFENMEKLCDRILFMKNGVISAIQPMHEIISTYGSIEKAYLKLTQC